MNKKFFTGMAVLLSASLFFLGCGGDDSDDGGPVLSGTASLGTAAGQAVVKGVNVVFTGSETGAALDTAVTGTATVVTNALADPALPTAFTAVESGSSKAVHVAAASAAAYTEADFNAAAPYANAAIAAGDVFFVKVTSQNGSNVKWYKITILEDALSTYALKTGEESSALPDTDSGLVILSAIKDASGVTVRLGGTLEPTYMYTADGTTAYPAADPAAHFPGKAFWMGATTATNPADGKYSNAYIQGLFSGLAEGNEKVIAIKQTNQALRFFTGATGNGYNTSASLSGPKTADHEDGGALSILTDTNTPPVRWRVYASGAKQPDEIWGFLIYDGTLAPKTAAFEITERQNYANNAAAASNGFTATVIVDYSAVNFGTGTLPSITLSKPTWTTDTPNAANVNEMMTRLWSTSAASMVQGITAGNVFTYAAATKTLTVNNGNVTDGLRTWITTQWCGTSVPVKVTLQSGTPSSSADANWSGAYLVWIDLGTTVTAGSQTVSLSGSGSETYTIAVTP
jgi:hypothetical protein